MADPAAFSGHVVVVTGAGRGIGRVLACRYGAAGATVVVAGRRREPLAETAALVEQTGATVHVMPTDIRVEADCDALVAETMERYGRLDVLCNNAAVPGVDQPVAEMTLDNWNDTIATNVTGPMLVTRAALAQAMLPARRGNIQFFSSAAAKSVVARKAHYAVAKLGLLPLTQTLAVEVGSYGIRVNTLVIGTTEGELIDGYVERIAREQAVDPSVIRTRLSATNALQRFVTPDEVADVSMWLASDAARAITGQNINVTAGGEKR